IAAGSGAPGRNWRARFRPGTLLSGVRSGAATRGRLTDGSASSIRPPATGPSRGRRDQRRWSSRLRKYGVMVILDPDTEERSVQPTLEQYLKIITNGGGSVDKLDIWGRRRLAYEIQKKSEGIYAVIDVTAAPDDVKELSRQFSINESIMRTKVIRP